MSEQKEIYELDREMSAVSRRYGGFLYQQIYGEHISLLENNIKEGIKPRKYQIEAVGRFLDYYKMPIYGKKNMHLMFNMATGSGKTLVLAQTILYLHSKGYHNFLFVSRLGNVVKKTVENLINSSSSKYLFAKKITINGKPVEIRQVENFDGSDSRDINILFSTLTNIHGKLTTYRENNLTYEGLSDEKNKLVIIADEAHNLSSYTKVKKKQSGVIDDGLDDYDISKLKGKDYEDFASWEGTIKKLLQTNPENILLEYTATIPQKPEIREKYDNKVIYQYDITKFRDDGYCKHPYTQTSNSTPMERALLATLTSFYRQHLAKDRGLFIKPVLLLKANRANISATFDENRDIYIKDFYSKYIEKINSLTVQDLKDLETKFGNEDLYSRVFGFFKQKEFDDGWIISEIKTEFGKDRILVNESGSDSEFRNLNTLEEKTNPYRVVMAVNTLDEGWDVLNLFDIVRLYENSSGKGNNTVAEAQLIGRGVRYNPMIDPENPEKDKYKRKFENSSFKNLETLYFHAINDSHYISQLGKELKNLGLSESKPYTFRVKKSFQESDFWQKAVLYKNGWEEKTADSKNPIEIYLENCKNREIKPVIYSFSVGGSGQAKEVLDTQTEAGDSRATSSYKFLKLIDKKFWLEAFDRVFYSFSSLVDKFSKCGGRVDFVENYLKDLEIRMTGEKKDLSDHLALSVAIKTLQELKTIIESNSYQKQGSKKFIQHSLKDVIKTEHTIFKKEEPLKIEISENEDFIAQDIIYGTSLEISFIKHIKTWVNQSDLDKSKIKLIRNEQYFAIHDFITGRPFYPDFVLYHTDRNETIQFFIEPKGGHLKGDEWKNDFLKEIENKVEINNPKFKVIGIPFYKEGEEESLLESLKAKIVK